MIERYVESELAERIGVRRDVLRNARKEVLEEGTDFELVTGEIRLTEVAVEKVLTHLGIAAPAPIPGGAESPAQAPETATDGRQAGTDGEYPAETALNGPDGAAPGGRGNVPGILAKARETVCRMLPARQKTPPGKARHPGRGSMRIGRGQKVLVVRRNYKNPRIVGATLDGELMRVRIKKARNIRIGMRVVCKHVKQDLWEYVGREPA